VFLTINLTQCKDPKFELTPEGTFSFSGKGGPDQTDHEVKLDLNGPIVVEDCKRLCNDLKMFFTLAKKETGYWPRLTKEKQRLHWLKIDFDKWKDEDDDEEEEGAAAKPDDYNMPGMEGFDMNAMMAQMGGGGGGGMPGMPGGGAPGGMDMAAMMAQMGAAGGSMPGMPSGGAEPADEDDEADSDDGDMPELE